MKKPYSKPELTPLPKRDVPKRFFTEIYLTWYPSSEYLECYARVPRGNTVIPVWLTIAGVNDLQMLDIVGELAEMLHVYPLSRFSDCVRYVMVKFDPSVKYSILLANPDDFSNEAHDDRLR